MTHALEENVRFLAETLKAGGPVPETYAAIADAFARLHAACYREVDGFSEMIRPIRALELFLQANAEVFRTTATMQGFAYAKPRGYAGDFEIIERIYDRIVSPDDRLAPWDTFFHTGAAPNAVRNRAGYIQDILTSRPVSSMLSLGCGSARDLSKTNEGALLDRITLVDADADAIAKARENLTNPAIDYTFLHKNVFRLKPGEPFDIVWSAGLFDYLNEKRAVHLLRRVRDMMAEGGEVVIGNFSKDNPSRPYMELVGEWMLIHRTEDEMAGLMTAAGFDAANVTVESDATGVNLFARAVR
jgi:SAM-dependent methyltransferase